MGGAPDGLFNTGTATVSLTDINDNPPTFNEILVCSLQSVLALKSVFLMLNVQLL